MTVLTVFLCGTGSTHLDFINKNYWEGELVATLANNHLGREFVDWFVIDGPGSGNLQYDDLWVKPNRFLKGLQDLDIPGVAKASQLAAQQIGQLTGLGWKENIKHAIHMIKGNFNWQREKLTKMQYEMLEQAGIPVEDVEVTGCFLWRHYDYGSRKVTQQELQEQIVKIFRKDGLIPTQVNIVGWSRGGVSCHMLANDMLKDSELKDIPVNIFAIDPVPGTGNFSAEKIELGKNVKEYVAFYARDERSSGFCCVIPKTHRETKVHIYPMAGRHATLVGNGYADGGSGKLIPQETPLDKQIAEDLRILYAPGRIVRHFAEVCLTRWGVKLEHKLNLNEEQISEFHEEMSSTKQFYDDMHKYVYTIPNNWGGERHVRLGNESKKFSAITGDVYSPSTGLASDYLMDKSIYKYIDGSDGSDRNEENNEDNEY